MKASRIWLAAAILELVVSPTFVAVAADPAETPSRNISWQSGPAEVPLTDQAILSLPSGYRALGPEDAQYALTSMGNFPSGKELALVAAQEPGEDFWFVVVRYVDAGYVPDDDAENWNADELMASIREGTDADNTQRKAAGEAPLLIRGWEEQPHYDKAAHKVVWAISHSVEGEDGVGVNYNTLALGRYGYISMNMVGDLANMEQLTTQTAALLEHLNFVEGKRYADFNSKTDTVAAVGLAALVAGVAAKTGLFAKLWGFLVPVLLIAKKFVVVIIVALAALVGRLWKQARKSPNQA